MCVLELRGGGVGDGHSRWHLQKKGAWGWLWTCFAGEPVPRPPSYAPEKLSWMTEMGFTWLVSLFPCGGVGFYSSARQLPSSPAPAPRLVPRMWFWSSDWLYQQKRACGLSLNWISCHRWEGFDRFGFFYRLLRMSWSPWIRTFQRPTISAMLLSPSLFLSPHLCLPLLPPARTPV